MSLTRTAYPTPSDFLMQLRAAKLSFRTDQQQAIEILSQSYVQSAIDKFEQGTEFIPFLAEPTDSTVQYTPQGPENRHGGPGIFARNGGGTILEFRGGYVSVTSVTVGMVPDPITAAMQGGTNLVWRLGYQLCPEDAPDRKRPYEWIRFTSRQYGTIGSIQIVGRRGFSATLREDVYRAIVAGAMCEAEGEIRSILNQGLLSWTEAGVTEREREDSLAASFEAWGKLYRRTMKQCQRIGMNF